MAKLKENSTIVKVSGEELIATEPKVLSMIQENAYVHPATHPASMITGLHDSAITGVAGSVAWGNVTGKPSTFPPSSHTHDYLPLSGGVLTGTLTVSQQLSIRQPTTTGGWARSIAYQTPDGASTHAQIYFFGSGESISRIGLNYGGYESSDGIHIVKSSGNVGIGTTSPSYTLHVIGDVGFSGTLQVGTVPWANISGAPATATRWPSWSEVTGKPSTFTPSSHNHAWSEITGKPSTFTPSSHSHSAGDLPSASTSAKGVVQLSDSTSSTSTTLAATARAVKAAYDVGNHSHPYAPSSHSHAWGDITGKPSTFTPSSHTHSWSQITSKPSSFPAHYS